MRSRSRGRDGTEAVDPSGLQKQLISLHAMRGEATTTFRELVLYVVFVVLFTVLVISTRGEKQFWFNHQLKRSFSTVIAEDDTIIEFSNVISDDLVWQYLESTMPLLYEETWYNGEAFNDTERGFLNWHNMLVGSVRLRQVRVRQDAECALSGLFEDAGAACSPEFSAETEDREPFGPGGPAFEWEDLGESAETLEQGFSGPVYARGSYATYLAGGRGEGAMNESQALEELAYLKDNLWIDERTRGVFMEWSVYNPGLNVFSVLRTSFEFRNTGVVTPYATFRVVQVREMVLGYQSLTELVLTGLEGVLVLFVLRYIWQELDEMRDEHRKGDWRNYFRMAWNYYDWVNLVCFLAVFYLRYEAYRKTVSLELTPDHMDDPTAFFDMQSLAYDLNLVKSFNALNSVLCWFKLFKYLELSPRMSQLTRTLNRASSELSSFFFMFLIVFWGFSLGFYSAFGADIADFKSIFFCIFSLFRTILGDFDFAAMEANKRYLGPLLFVLYIVLVFFVLMNMFLAIINGAYQQTYDDLKRRGNDAAGDMLYKVVSEKLRLRSVRKRVESRRKLAVVAPGGPGGQKGGGAAAAASASAEDGEAPSRPATHKSTASSGGDSRPGTHKSSSGRASMGPPIASAAAVVAANNGGVVPAGGVLDPATAEAMAAAAAASAEKTGELDDRVGRLEADVAAMSSMMEGLAVTLERISQQQQALLRGDPAHA